VGAAKGLCFGPEHVHRLTGAVPGRVSVSYADELRPLDSGCGPQAASHAW
jgi:hypothetical protein